VLKLRRDQMAAFEERALAQFEPRMLAHLRRCFPRQCEALGDSNVREAIRYGIERAGSYDIVAERDVCMYIELMFIFGRDFDTDKRFPWASEILNDDLTPDPSVKVRHLYDEGLARQDEGEGLALKEKRAP